MWLIAYCNVSNFCAAFVSTDFFSASKFALTLCFCFIVFFISVSFKYICMQVLFTRGDVPMPISELPGCVNHSSFQFSSLYYSIIIFYFVSSLKFLFTSQACIVVSFYCFNRLVCGDISNGQETFPIPATNLVDNPPIPPSGMLQTWKETSYPLLLALLHIFWTSLIIWVMWLCLFSAAYVGILPASFNVWGCLTFCLISGCNFDFWLILVLLDCN